jgi:probable rRNA maturation factor
MPFRVHLNYLAPLGAAALPVRPRAIRALLAGSVKRLAGEPEWLETVSHLGGKPDSLALLFCDDVEMRKMQRRHRRLDRTTDVLSFPTREVPGMAGAFAWLPKGERSLGDLVVSLPAVTRGAKRGRRSLAAELSEVLMHGLLHLLGCDHVKVPPSCARRMRALQKNLVRGLGPRAVRQGKSG